MRFIFVSILILLSSLFAYAEAESPLNFLYYYQDESQSDKVSFEIIKNELLLKEADFVIEASFNSEEFKEICRKTILFDEETPFKKITCELERKEEGSYTIRSKLIQEETILDEVIHKEIFQKDLKTSLSFFEKEEETIIIIEIQGTSEDITILHEIPKKALERITQENKESLRSSHEFEIIKEDPLIAWHVDKTPQTINYTISKKLNSQTKEQFNLAIKNNKEFQILKTALFLAIILMLALIIKPLFAKKKHNKSK